MTITNPDKVFFPETGQTKLDLVNYYLAVADGALAGVRDRPMAMKRFVDGAAGAFFFQKRAPESRPALDRHGRAVVPVRPDRLGGRRRDAAALAWVVNLGCIDLNPHPVRADDLDHPDELRVDLDPVPGVEWPQIRQVALVDAGGAGRARARRLAEDVRLAGHPHQRPDRAAVDLPGGPPRGPRPRPRRRTAGAGLATSRWWKEERHGVFLDYNQNAKDRTVASAYSIRPTPDARASMPLRWDEVETCRAGGLHARAPCPRSSQSAAMPGRGSTRPSGSLESLLELSARARG